MMVIRAGIRKLLVRVTNRTDPDQTASSEAVRSGSDLFVYAFGQVASVPNFRTFTVCYIFHKIFSISKS